MELEHQRRRTTPDGAQPDPESREVEDREKSWRSGARSSRSKVNGSRFVTELSVLMAALRDFSTSEANSNWIWRGSHGSGAVLTHSGAVLADSNEFMVMSWNSGMFGEDYAANWTGSRDSIMVGTDSGGFWRRQDQIFQLRRVQGQFQRCCGWTSHFQQDWGLSLTPLELGLEIPAKFGPGPHNVKIHEVILGLILGFFDLIWAR